MSVQLQEQHEADLRRSGLSSATIEAAGFRSASAAEANHSLGRNDLRGFALEIPYPSLNGRAPFSRYRPDKPPTDRDGRKAKYLTAKGAGNRLYFPPILPDSVLQDTERGLLLTEGEKKALKATQEGFPCIGLAGVWCFRGRDKNDESRPLADLDHIEWHGREVWIVFDSDLAEKPEVQRAEAALAEELQRRGAVVRAVRLPDGPAGTKVGLDDFLVMHSGNGPSEFRKLLKEAKPFGSFGSVSNGYTAETKWPEPQPLPVGLPDVETFDLNLLPDAFRRWIADIAERMQCPPDFAAIPAVVRLGAVVGRQIGMRPKQQDDWTVIPNLWGGIIGRPSVLKSPAMQESRKAVKALEARAGVVHEDEMRKYESRRLVGEAESKSAKKNIERETSNGNKAKALEYALTVAAAEEEKPPGRRRYELNDPTSEKLIEIHRDNARGLLVHRDELVGFLKALDKDGREGDRSLFLESWNGDNPYTQDRIGRRIGSVGGLNTGVPGGATWTPQASVPQ